MTTSYTSFGNLYNIVDGIKSLVGSSTQLVKDVSINSSTLTVSYGNTDATTIDLSSLGGGGGGASGVGIQNIEYNSSTSILTFTLTDASTISITGITTSQGDKGDTGPKGDTGLKGDTGTVDYSFLVDISNSVTDLDPCIKDAFHDFLAILPPLTGNKVLVLPSNTNTEGSKYKRTDGKILRFFNNTSTTEEFYYDIQEKDATSLFTINPQEVYSMIWITSKWIIIPGLINVKSRPSGYTFENIPGTPPPEAPPEPPAEL